MLNNIQNTGKMILWLEKVMSREPIFMDRQRMLIASFPRTCIYDSILFAKICKIDKINMAAS